MAVRVQGLMRGYHIGFDGTGKVSVYKNDFGYKKLSQCDFNWTYNKRYHFKIETMDDQITFFIDNQKIIEFNDNQFGYGMYGFSTLTLSRTLYNNLRFYNHSFVK